MTHVESSTAKRNFLLRVIACPDAARVGSDLRVDDSLMMGRDPACGFVVSEAGVSRRHARFEYAADGIKVVDLGSANGVWRGEDRVTEAVLHPGDQCRIGSTILECREELPVIVDVAPTMMSPAIPGVAAAAPGVPFTVSVIEGGTKVSAGARTVVETGEATIGRSKDCAIFIDEVDVSRRHAKIEAVPGGYRVTDLGSTCGVWVDKRQVTSEVVAPGQAFRVGRQVVLSIAPVTAAGPAAEEVEADGTRMVSAAEMRQYADVKAPAAAVPPVAPPAVAPPPVEEVEADGTRMVSVAELQQYEKAKPAAPPVEEVEADGTRMVSAAEMQQYADAKVAAPAPPAEAPRAPTATVAPALATTGRIEEEGEVLELSPHKPLLLQDARSVWYVANGAVMIFTVAVEKGEPVGTRTHFLEMPKGTCFFGFDLAQYGIASGFLAVAAQGTKVRKIQLSRFQQMASEPTQAATIAAMVDPWVKGLAKALMQNVPTKREGEVALKGGERVELDLNKKATSGEGLVWVPITSGSVLFNEMAIPMFDRRRVLFPVSPDCWIQPVSDEFGVLDFKPLRTEEAVADPLMWHGLGVFHQVLCECEFINKRLATVDEYVRLQRKAEQSEAAAAAGYDAIGSVLRTEAATPREFLETTASEPVLQACRAIGQALGIEVRPHPGSEEGMTYEEQVNAIASASGFRTRVVALRDDWWRADQGPMLAQLGETRDVVALLPKGPRVYECLDPRTGKRTPINKEIAGNLSDFAYTFYRPFPDGELKVTDVVKFGVVGLQSDVRWLVLMAVVIGMFGTITPYLTGQVLDTAVPQADRGMLWGFGIALLGAAFATSMFKLTQGVATVRLQARMSSSIQAAVWDRIMNLPVSFFRKYSAGDLADRAAGVEAIQELVAGAGVAAILGSVSGLFFVGQMFSYNLRLALLAVALTLFYVGVNMFANYLQLRYQRREMQLRGRLQGLVLNLLTGVSKLRIAGAERHAFRVWAEQFASQRKLSFKGGTIQNTVAVFGAVYPILCSIAIFMVMIAEQERMATSHEPGLTTGQFVAFNSAFGMFLAAMQALGDASLSLLRVVPIYERLTPILVTKPEVDRTKAFPGKLKGGIEMSHLHFRYDADGPYIVRDLSLTIKPGEFVAFVGASGCGKSTLMRLMLGFETPSSGSIFFDGQELASLDLRMVRQQIGVVLQQSRVMPTEMYRNICGVTFRTIEDAWDAAEKAGLADDIKAMPMGMHTYVSEGGGTLSGGQRQRLMIARAIVNKPKIIFLDEATSALDNRTQAIVSESMNKMDATRIVIAHRLSTIENADRICYLDAGQIVEMGNYAELMAKDGLFAALAKRQVA
jgi:NHLM bacteriocin system ABC transporter ATP-binding protein